MDNIGNKDNINNAKQNQKNQENHGLNTIKKMYENLTYFDQYGFSLILFIIITILLIIFIGSCVALANIQPIQQDWPNQRCKPYILPIAGFINKPPNMSVGDFTAQNFNYCTQSILKEVTGFAVQPLTYVTNVITQLVDLIKEAINDIRAMMDKIRTFFATIVQEIMGRLLNIIIPLQQIIIKFKDFASKLQGTMTAGLLATLGSFLTLKSLLGAIAKFIVTILIALAAMIAIFWIFPFTWGTAIASTAIFVAIAIPMSLILAFMTNVLGINSGLSIPSVKCFDKNTKITMNNGTVKTISEIEVGEKMSGNVLITAKIIVESKGSVMYNLHDVIVSDSHIVRYNNQWIRVDQHPSAIKIAEYAEPYLYCINTENKVIEMNGILFTDWDEIYDDELEKIKNMKLKNVLFNMNKTLDYSMNDINVNNSDIHKYLDGGFDKNTEIKLKNGVTKTMKSIHIGDVLENGERVYGYVEIDGTNLREQAVYNLAKNRFINGGSNLNICDKSMGFTSTLELNTKYKKIITNYETNDKLYHLLTDSKTFHINGVKFYDYNSCIDLFLEKYRGKLLSMKYV
jgi:hypothetical protein